MDFLIIVFLYRLVLCQLKEKYFKLIHHECENKQMVNKAFQQLIHHIEYENKQ